MNNLLLIGSGKWGKNYISTLDRDFPNIKLKIANRNNWKQLVDENPDGVIISTPPQSHIEIAEYSLQKNIPTMIEKPLSLSSIEIDKIKIFSAPILVNHIHLFSDAYLRIKEIIDPDKIDHIESAGYGNGPIRNYSSLWDYGPHDISLILDLTNKMPHDIKVWKYNFGHNNMFDILMSFGTFYSSSRVGNAANDSSRTLRIDCDGIKIGYDDKKRPQNHNAPLTNVIKVFIDAIHGKNDYRIGLDMSVKVCKILELCEQYLALSH